MCFCIILVIWCVQCTQYSTQSKPKNTRRVCQQLFHAVVVCALVEKEEGQSIAAAAAASANIQAKNEV